MGAGPSSIADAVGWLRAHFLADSARGVDVGYQIELSGPLGGVLSAQIRDGELEAVLAPLSEPDVVFQLSAENFFAVIAGQANPDLLFLSEDLRVEGDLSLALKLRTLFTLNAAPRA